MPTYSYRCTECDNAFDIHQAFSDDSLTECPVCGGKLRKVFSAVGVTFNGSGFYRTDSRAKTSEGGSSSSATPKTESGSGSSPSSDKKAAAPTPAKPASTGSSTGGSTSTS